MNLKMYFLIAMLCAGLTVFVVSDRLCLNKDSTVHISTKMAIVFVGDLLSKRTVSERNQVVSYDTSYRLDFRNNFLKYPCRVDIVLYDSVLKTYLINTNDTVIRVPHKIVGEIRYYMNDQLITRYYSGIQPMFWNLSSSIYKSDTCNRARSLAQICK